MGDTGDDGGRDQGRRPERAPRNDSRLVGVGFAHQDLVVIRHGVLLGAGRGEHKSDPPVRTFGARPEGSEASTQKMQRAGMTTCIGERRVRPPEGTCVPSGGCWPVYPKRLALENGVSGADPGGPHATI